MFVMCGMVEFESNVGTNIKANIVAHRVDLPALVETHHTICLKVLSFVSRRSVCLVETNQPYQVSRKT